MQRRFLLTALPLVLPGLFVFGCRLLPTGIILQSAETDRELGKEVAEPVSDQIGIYQDSELDS